MQSTYKIILDEVKQINKLIVKRENLSTGKKQIFFDGEGDQWKWFKDKIQGVHDDLHFPIPEDQIYKHVEKSLDLIEETLTHLADVYLDIDESSKDWESVGEMPSYDVFYDLREALRDGGLDVAPIYTGDCLEWLATCSGLRIENVEEILQEHASAGFAPDIPEAVRHAFNREFEQVLFSILTEIECHLVEVHMHGDTRFSE